MCTNTVVIHRFQHQCRQFSHIVLQPTLELLGQGIDLSKKLDVDGDLLLDLLDGTNHRGVVPPVEDTGDHRVGIVVE